MDKYFIRILSYDKMCTATFNITTLSIMGSFVTLSLNNIQHNDTRDTRHISIECCYAECNYAGCRDQINVMLSDCTINVVILIPLMLNVLILSVVMLNVIMLNVMAPIKGAAENVY